MKDPAARPKHSKPVHRTPRASCAFAEKFRFRHTFVKCRAEEAVILTASQTVPSRTGLGIEERKGCRGGWDIVAWDPDCAVSNKTHILQSMHRLCPSESTPALRWPLPDHPEFFVFGYAAGPPA